MRISGTLIAVCTVMFALVSCQEKKSDRPQFASIKKDEILRADGSRFELDYRFEYLSWCSNEEVVRNIQASMTAQFFGEEYVRSNPMESAKAFDQAVTSQYGNSSSGDHVWGFMKIRSYNDVVNDRIVGFTIERDEYMGGAHGMETIEYSNYDLRTGNRLSLDDVFTPDGKAALADRIRQAILKDHKKENWEQLNEGNCYFEMAEVRPTDNFLLSQEHITFAYNAYDIACYAQGHTKVELPLNGLDGFMKDILEK